MFKKYQEAYAAGRPQMYDWSSRRERGRRITKILKDFLGKDRLESLSLLDLGCSTGIITGVLAGKFKKVVGIDIDQEAIGFAKKMFRKKNLRFMTADVLNLPFKNRVFDLVVCSHLYEHVPDQKKLFSEIWRVLKSGGVCYLAAQNRLWPWEPHYDLPLLSWLPKSVAKVYIRLMKGITEYFETPLTYWGLKKLVGKFTLTDYTGRILQSPGKFGYNNLGLPPVHLLTLLFSPLGRYLSPTFFWLLKKK